MLDVSVADLLAFDTLPEDVRVLCEKKMAHEQAENYERGFRDGSAEGHEEGYTEGCEGSETLREQLAAANATITALRAQLETRAG